MAILHMSFMRSIPIILGLKQMGPVDDGRTFGIVERAEIRINSQVLVLDLGLNILCPITTHAGPPSFAIGLICSIGRESPVF